MQFTENGLKLHKTELTALLAFASDAPERPNLYGVHFLQAVGGVKARATNGHIALDAIGPNEAGGKGEWFVHRDFLKGALKGIDKASFVVLQFEAGTLHEAHYLNDDDVEIATFSWPQNAANAQTSFPDREAWQKIMEPPRGKNARCVTLNAEYLSLMSKVSRAAGVLGIECYPPPSAKERACFRCEGTDTTWLAVVAPMNTEHDEDDKPVADANGRFADDVANHMRESLADSEVFEGTRVTMTTMDGEEVVLNDGKPKSKGRKKK